MYLSIDTSLTWFDFGCWRGWLVKLRLKLSIIFICKYIDFVIKQIVFYHRLQGSSMGCSTSSERKDLQERCGELNYEIGRPGIFKVKRFKRLEDIDVFDHVLVAYPRSIDDLVRLKKLATGLDYRVVTSGLPVSLNDLIGGKKYMVVDLSKVSKEKIQRSPRSVKTIYQRRRSDIEDKIRQIYGEVPPINEENFSNWCGNQTNTSVFAARPQNLQQIQTLVKYARDNKWRVRCAGRKHSWSPLFADEGQMLLYMDQMESDYPNDERIRLVQTSPTIQVDVLAGVSLEDLKNFELNNKVNLPCNTILTVVQLVSVVVSGCHGVGWNFKTPADYVTKIRIVNSSGALVTYSTDNMSQLRAAVTSYGLFGVVYDVRITMFPQKNAKVRNTYNTVNEIYYNPENMKTLVEGNQSVEMFWLPFNSFPTSEYNPKNDKIWIRLINQTDKPHVLEPEAYYEKQSRWALITETALKKYTPDLNKNPELFSFADWVSFQLIKDEIYPEGTIYQEFPNAVHWRPHLEIGVVYDMEFAFDFKGDYGMICKAIQFVIDKVVSYHKIKKYPLNVVLEMRWMAYSEAYMCPAVIGNPENGGSGHVVYLEILSVVGTEGWEDFCKEIGTEWMKYGGVPHLAKQWSFLPGIDTHLRKMFGNNMVQFIKELKNSNADPDGIFQNDRLQELLYSKN